MLEFCIFFHLAAVFITEACNLCVAVPESSAIINNAYSYNYATSERLTFSVIWFQKTRRGKEHSGGTSNIEDAGKFKFQDVWSYQVSRQYIAYLSNSSQAKYYLLSSFFLSCISFV